MRKKGKQINFTEFETENKFELKLILKILTITFHLFLQSKKGVISFVSFCVVPYTRGPECSRSFNNIVQEAKNSYRAAQEKLPCWPKC